MHRSKATLAALLTTAALLMVAAAPVSAASPNAEAKAKAEHNRIIKYWTAEKIRNAKPRDFVRQPNGEFKAAKPGNPNARPPGGGGGGTSTGASWSGGGAVVQRTGKVLFTMGGGQYVCSATVIQDGRSTHSLVMTAGHCAYDEVARAFATNWLFIPAFDTAPTFTCAQTAIGCWTATGLVVHSGYATAGGFNEQATYHDFAVAIVAGGGRTGTATQLDTAVGGGYAVSYPGISTGGSVHAFGYPAAGRYKGKDLTYCAGPTFNDNLNGNGTWGIACNMTGGSSGGPWFANFTGTPSQTSLNSYGYSGLSNMYGPKFNSDTQAVVNAAATRTGNYIVP